MKVYIKNMVCQGTRKFVLQEVKRLGLRLKSFEAHVIEFHRELTNEETQELICSLKKYGLEVSSVKSNQITVHEIAYEKENPVISLEEYLSDSNGDKSRQPVLNRI